MTASFYGQFECALAYSMSGLCMQIRNLFLHNSSKLPFKLKRNYHFLFVDFAFLVFPMLLVQTHLAPFLFPATLLLFLAVLMFSIKSTNPPPSNSINESQMLQNAKMMFKSIFLICTGLAILAVDFSSFPQSFHKRRTFGLSVMDSGTGAFIFLNAISDEKAESGRGISPRQRARSTMQFCGLKMPTILILFILGIGRLLFLKMFSYGYDITEYGVHMNFFFILFFLRIFIAIIPSKWLVIFGICLGIFYQFALNLLSLEIWLLDLKIRRHGLLDQNREGLFSLFGYFFIYSLSMGFARAQSNLHKRNARLAPFFGLLFGLVCLVFQIGLFILFGMQSSRRIANISYGLGSVAIFSSSITGLWLFQMIIPLPLSTQNCLVNALARNGLFHFFIANLLTALVNLAIPLRLFRGNGPMEICVLSIYGLTNVAIVQWFDGKFNSKKAKSEEVVLPICIKKGRAMNYWI